MIQSYLADANRRIPEAAPFGVLVARFGEHYGLPLEPLRPIRTVDAHGAPCDPEPPPPPPPLAVALPPEPSQGPSISFADLLSQPLPPRPPRRGERRARFAGVANASSRAPSVGSPSERPLSVSVPHAPSAGQNGEVEGVPPPSREGLDPWADPPSASATYAEFDESAPSRAPAIPTVDAAPVVADSARSEMCAFLEGSESDDGVVRCRLLQEPHDDALGLKPPSPSVGPGTASVGPGTASVGPGTEGQATALEAASASSEPASEGARGHERRKRPRAGHGCLGLWNVGGVRRRGCIAGLPFGKAR